MGLFGCGREGVPEGNRRGEVRVQEGRGFGTGAYEVVGVKRSDGVWRSGVWLENVGGEMYTLVEEFEEEDELGIGAASGERREIKLRLNRGNEKWAKFGGEF